MSGLTLRRNNQARFTAASNSWHDFEKHSDWISKDGFNYIVTDGGNTARAGLNLLRNKKTAF